MHFGLSEEQVQLRDAVRGFLGQVRGARQVLEGGDAEDPAVWARICEEQAWQAVLVPEEQGGFGFGTMELAVVLEEVGRRLTPCPLLGTAFATVALRAARPSAARDEALEALASGSRGAVAFGAQVEATAQGLRGAADRVVGGRLAEVIVVEGRDGYFLVRGGEIAREALEVLDPTRPMARLELHGVSGVELVGCDRETVRMACEVLVAAEAVGAAEATLEQAVDYARVRQQFGRPIGSFQAIQHKCADMMVRVESARSAAWYGAWAVDSGADDARLAARTALAMASDALLHCAGENIQIHGGIGFTWEHDAHLYFRRARTIPSLLGASTEHRAAVADVLLGAL